MSSVNSKDPGEVENDDGSDVPSDVHSEYHAEERRNTIIFPYSTAACHN